MPSNKLSRTGGPSSVGGDTSSVGSSYSLSIGSQRRKPRSPERQSRPTVREMDSPSQLLPESAEPTDIADSADTSGQEIATPPPRRRTGKKHSAQ